jgi:hypothetical protein
VEKKHFGKTLPTMYYQPAEEAKQAPTLQQTNYPGLSIMEIFVEMGQDIQD